MFQRMERKIYKMLSSFEDEFANGLPQRFLNGFHKRNPDK